MTVLASYYNQSPLDELMVLAITSFAVLVGVVRIWLLPRRARRNAAAAELHSMPSSPLSTRVAAAQDLFDVTDVDWPYPEKEKEPAVTGSN